MLSSCWLEIFQQGKKNIRYHVAEKVLRCDSSLKASRWPNQVQHILQNTGIDVDLNDDCMIDLDILKSRLLRLNKNKWHVKPKQSFFVKIYTQSHYRR